MRYIINSEKVGVVGTEFIPGAGTNIAALLAHGFIVSDELATTNTAVKPAKNKTTAKKD